MNKLFTALFCLIALSVFGANPSFESFNTNQFNATAPRVGIKSGALITNSVLYNVNIQSGNGGGLTNVNVKAGTNILWLSGLIGSDTEFQWGNPAKPVRTLTNAFKQCEITFSNSAASVIALPEVFDYTSTHDGGLTVRDVDITFIAWGAIFKGFRDATESPQNFVTFSTNCIFSQYGGHYVFTNDWDNNGGYPMSSKEARKIHLFGVTVDCKSDNFFWTQQGTFTGDYSFEHCSFISAWDINVIAMANTGTNSTFRWKYCTFTKSPRLLGVAVEFNAINMASKGILRLDYCKFNADDPLNTDVIKFIRSAKTNIINNCSFRGVTTNSTGVFPFETIGGVAANRPYYYAQNNSFSPAWYFTNSPNSFVDSYLLITTNEFVLNTFYTNAALRSYVQVTVGLLSGVGGNAQVALYIDQDQDGSFERTGITESLTGIAASATNAMGAFIQPLGRFVFTNLSSGGGAANIQANSSEWVRP